MFLSSARFLAFVSILLVVLYSASECKRGGGGRRGSLSRGSSVWSRSRQQGTDNRNNQRKSKNQGGEDEMGKKPGEIIPDPSKPSAPPSPSKTDTSKLSSNAGTSHNTPGNAEQRPIGWNTGNTNSHPPPNSPPPYPGTGPGSNYRNPPPPYPGTGPGTNYGNPPPPYPGTGSGNYYHGQGHAHQQVPGQYGAPIGQPGQYHPNMNSYGGAPMGGGFFGGGKYNQHGYGGFGGVGGYGGYGLGGYGKKFGGGFGMGFGSHAVRNVVMGVLVWHLISGFNRRPYNVYNYYNNPEKVPNEIPLPANVITLCPENVTSLCAPNTAPLCTSESAIMCVVLAEKTVPCGDNSTLKCVNSTAACTNDEDNLCDGKNHTLTSVNIPCITNATITGKVNSNVVSGLNTGDKTELCVTTLALPQPEEERRAFNQTACQLENGSKLENTNSTACDNTQQLQNLTTVTTHSSVEKNDTKHSSS